MATAPTYVTTAAGAVVVAGDDTDTTVRTVTTVEAAGAGAGDTRVTVCAVDSSPLECQGSGS